MIWNTAERFSFFEKRKQCENWDPIFPILFLHYTYTFKISRLILNQKRKMTDKRTTYLKYNDQNQSKCFIHKRKRIWKKIDFQTACNHGKCFFNEELSIFFSIYYEIFLNAQYFFS